jgi:hypothetical protein
LIRNNHVPSRLPPLGLLPLLIAAGCGRGASETDAHSVSSVRFATFNVALHRGAAGELVRDLKTGDCPQARALAEIIQRVRPDVLLLNEIDHDADGEALRLFCELYLERSQNGQRPIDYPYRFQAGVNAGLPSGLDLDGDGRHDEAEDALGFGRYPGQYGMAVLSSAPIDGENVRTFQKFLWKDMPGARLPVEPRRGRPYYSKKVLAAFRLSSKSHWDLPLKIGSRTVHLLVCHPTPPVFDGPEDRNGSRNHDEIRFWADYVSPDRSQYIYDDNGRRGGLARGEWFVIAGDMNADPWDGGGPLRAIRQLLEHPLIDGQLAPRSAGGLEQSELQGGANQEHRGDPACDTADFSDEDSGNLRVDYVLLCRQLQHVESGVFWPLAGDPDHALVAASDHRLVWVDAKHAP